MEKKKINKDKIQETIVREEKFLKEQYKQLQYNRELKPSQRSKVLVSIEKSEKNLDKLKAKLK